MGAWNLKPLQNGSKDMPLKLPVSCMGLHTAWISERCPVDLFVVPDEVEVREKILPGDQYQVFQLSAVHIIKDFLFLLGKIGEKALVDHFHGLVYQVGNRLIMQVESGAVYTGLVADLFNRDILQILLLQQCDKRLIHPQGGFEVFALGLVHLPPSSRFILPLR